MVRTSRLSRHVMRFGFLVPFLPMLTAACGGSDTLPESPDDATAAPDGAEPDEAAAVDSAADGTLPENDGSTAEAGFVADAADGSEPMDASDASAVRDGSRVIDASLDATTDASLDASIDASRRDASVDASDATDASDASDARDASDASDASDGAASMEGILGSATNFAVFSGATVSNATTTVTTITGDLGTYPSPTAIGVTPPVVVGNEFLGDGVAQVAASDIQTAYDKLSPGQLPCGTNLTSFDLGGRTLAPGVYCFASTAGLTGTLTLDAQNDPNARWVFQIGSSLTTASASKVVVINGAPGQACNVFWQVTSSATLGTNSVFGGNILAQAAVTVTTFTSILGRAFGLTGEVSTDTNVISIALCAPPLPALDGGVDADIVDAHVADAPTD